MKNKIESIQILRGLAALSVVLFHYRFYLVPTGSDMTVPDKLFGWGAFGVDLFFVISGFIMIYVTNDIKKGLSTSIRFLKNRLLRILPTYYLILLFAFLTGGAMSTFHYPEKAANLISALTFNPYVIDNPPFYINSSGMYNIRWTINYELYFYLAFSVCLLFKNRFIALAMWFLFPIALAFFSKESITISTAGYHYSSIALRFITNPIIFEFGIGVLAGYTYLFLRDKFKTNKPYLSFTFIILIAIGLFTRELNIYNVTSSLVYFFLILSFALENNTLLRYKCIYTPLVKLGNISFSLYLIHSPVAIFIFWPLKKSHPELINTYFGLFIMVITAILFAWLSYRFIEVKLTNKIRDVLLKER